MHIGCHDPAQHGQALGYLDRNAEAEPVHRQALAVRRKLLGEKHPHTADIYDSLAVNLNGRGQHREAEPLYRKALAIRRNVHGEDDPAVALSYANLAFNLEDQGKRKEAEGLYRQAWLSA